MSYQARLKKEYNDRIISALKEEYSYKNFMEVPKLQKIVLSRGIGSAVADKKLIDYAVEELTNISGQKAIPTISKKDVAAFKLRKGMPIGVKVTLRGQRMYEFLDRLVTTALPRVRDFQGVKASGFDGRGNYNFGISEQIRGMPRAGAKSISSSTNASSELRNVIGSRIDCSLTDEL